MNNQLKVDNGTVIQIGEQREFGRILSNLRTEIEKLKTIRLRFFGNSD